jgi:hypothetical protein
MPSNLNVDDPVTGNSGSQKTEGGVLDTAKRAAGEVVDKVRDTAANRVERQRETVASGLSSVADAFRHLGDGLKDETPTPIAGIAAGLGNKVGNQVDQVAHYLEDRDIRQIAADTESFARRHPVLFVGGAFLMGLAISRFLKSATRLHDGSSFAASQYDLGTNRERAGMNDSSVSSRPPYSDGSIYRSSEHYGSGGAGSSSFNSEEIDKNNASRLDDLR